MRNSLLLLTVLPAANSATAADVEQKRPNILFILSDDHALKGIGAYG
jgi:hypothetical protein